MSLFGVRSLADVRALLYTLLREVWDQLRGPQGKGWPQLGGRTIVDSLAEAHRKLDELLGRSK